MLPIPNRLRNDRDIARVMRFGRRGNGEYMLFAVADSSRHAVSRFAVVAGLTVHKSAVKRNAVRRKIREAVRLLLKQDRIRPGVDGVFVAHKESVGKSMAEIRADVEALLFRAGLLKSAPSPLRRGWGEKRFYSLSP